MFRKLAVSAVHIRPVDLVKGLFLCLAWKNPIKKFERELSGLFHSKYCFTTGSAEAAFWVILKTLSDVSDKKEVIIPGYTYGALAGVIRKLGLKTVCCDVSPDSFDFNRRSLVRLIKKDTLCVVAVHAFGLPCDLKPLQDMAGDKGIYLVEDFTHASGSYYHEDKVGSSGDLGFTGFHTDCNFSTYSGGCVVTGNAQLAGAVSREVNNLKSRNSLYVFKVFMKLMMLAFLLKPVIYRWFPFSEGCLNGREEKETSLKKYTGFQASIGILMLKSALDANIRRLFNGTFLLERLKGNKSVRVPGLPVYSRAVFNLLPVVFNDSGMKEEAKRQLAGRGIESADKCLSLLKPLPNSKEFNQKLLALPVHEYVSEEDINIMVEVIDGLNAD